MINNRPLVMAGILLLIAGPSQWRARWQLFNVRTGLI